MKIAIYGAGNYGQYVYNEIIKNEHAKVSVVSWIDNYSKEEKINELPVFTEDNFFKLGKNEEIDAIVVAARDYGSNLVSQKLVVSLLLRGYKQVYIALPEFFNSQVPIINKEGGFSSFIKFYKDVLPTENMMLGLILNRCNLNCKRCEHGSNLVHENDFLELEKFESYLIQLKKKFKNILRFQLLGGEPLLNPQLDKYIVLTRKYFPATKIEVVTNGLLIPKMSANLIDVIVKNNAFFWITQYPPTRQILDQIMDVLDKNRIVCELTPPRVQFRRWVTLKQENGEKAFEKWKDKDCSCHAIDKGRIYICPLIFKLYDMKEYLDIQIEDNELLNSSLDLMSDEIDGWDILQYYTFVTPICRYCSPDNVLENWEVGQPDKADYFAD